MSQALVRAQQGGHLQLNPIKLKEGWTLKKLTEKHKTIIALHLQNVSRVDIAQVADCTPEYVSMIVTQPLALQYRAELEKYTDERLKTLYSRSVDAIEDALDSGDEEVRLKAARLQMEATGKLRNNEKEGNTAEDVVANILRQATVVIGQNVQINQNGDR